jgi:PucR family transcriptional regulator, purine catabolism regulatory protein
MKIKRYLLAPLLMKDDPKMKELLKTLYVFLQCGGNLECSMKELNISNDTYTKMTLL